MDPLQLRRGFFHLKIFGKFLYLSYMKYIITEGQYKKILESKGITNKFNFEVGKIYEFEELPQAVQNDIEVQFEEDYENSPKDFNYRAILLYPDDIEEYLHSQFGEHEIGDAIQHPHMKKLIKNIKNNGIDYPSVGFEGNHRALACYALNIPLPYLQFEKI
jgi:hypothetical protein